LIQITTALVVDANNISRSFRSGSATVHALRNVNLQLNAGEMVALRGRSGSGKTTLLNIIAGLDDPSEGEIALLGQPLRGMPEAARAKLRREGLGMLYQNAHLFPALTAQENVEIPLRLAQVNAAERTARAQEALRMVGLAARANHRGLELSGGEQQRVALARALVHTPRLVLADEPTGNLDSMTGRDIVNLLRDIAHQSRIGFLVATHDATVVAAADRIVQMSDGVLTPA
jgi:putative ABC transport system ATP-binding protein